MNDRVERIIAGVQPYIIMWGVVRAVWVGVVGIDVAACSGGGVGHCG